MNTVIRVIIGLTLVLMTVGMSLLLLARACGGGGKTQYGLKSVEWLPASATDINVHETWGLAHSRTYECTIPEADFRVLASQRKWPLTETNDINVLFRYVFDLKPLRTVGGEPWDIVGHALFFEKRDPDGAGCTAVYDLETRRLYCDYSSR